MHKLEAIVDSIRQELEAKNAARDAALQRSRTLTRYCANAIRATHRGDVADAEDLLGTAREAAKQSRRLRVPAVTEPLTTSGLADRAAGTGLALVLHEEATTWLTESDRPDSGEVMIIVGPEGGIAPEELSVFAAAGACPVRISDGVLRTSTAGVVAVGLLRAR